jgi:hypothetical protein
LREKYLSNLSGTPMNALKSAAGSRRYMSLESLAVLSDDPVLRLSAMGA